MIVRDDLPPTPDWSYSKPEPEPTIGSHIVLGEN